MHAVLSDIHGNLEAIDAVREDIARQGARDVICLGDTIGYGPNPKECLDLARDFGRTLLGNHDEAALLEEEAERFSVKARNAIDWTRSLLESPGDRAANSRRWDFLGEMPRSYESDGVLYVHGSPRDPTHEYLFPRDACRLDKATAVFALFDRLCFTGHTHIPGVWVEDMTFLTPGQVSHSYRLDGRKTVVNVGSVGQPRDDDPRACYVLFDEDRIEFRRIRYAAEHTVAKIMSIPQLHPYLAHRLRAGQ